MYAAYPPVYGVVAVPVQQAVIVAVPAQISVRRVAILNTHANHYLIAEHGKQISSLVVH